MCVWGGGEGWGGVGGELLYYVDFTELLFTYSKNIDTLRTL